MLGLKLIFNMPKKDVLKEEDGKNFASLLKDFVSKVPKAEELVKGTVISIDNGAVRIDIDGLATGVVRGPELFTESSEYNNIKVGDTVEATVIEQENENGEVELSFRAVGNQFVWDRMEKYAKDGLALSAKVLQANKGGLMMQVEALIGFMPVSQLSPENYPRVPGGDKNKILEHLQKLIGKEMQVRVIDVNPKEEKLIVSEKAVWEDDQKAVLDSYKIGTVVTGEISAITSFGAFMRFGEGLEGLIHISEIAWQRIDHPKDMLKVGDRVSAQIIDLNKSKIYLSIKRLIDDPWKAVKDKYKVGQKVTGEIHKVEQFGLMVKLDKDIHGLAHISEVSDIPLPDKDLKEKFAVGSVHEFEIINIEPSEHRLGLKVAGVKGKLSAKDKSAEKTEEKPAKQEAQASKEEAVKSE
jgi:small subunit ribosomal protein S1